MVSPLKWMTPLAQLVKRPTTYQQPIERECWKVIQTHLPLSDTLRPHLGNHTCETVKTHSHKDRQSWPWTFLPGLSASFLPWLRPLPRPPTCSSSFQMPSLQVIPAHHCQMDLLKGHWDHVFQILTVHRSLHTRFNIPGGRGPCEDSLCNFACLA